MIKLHELLLEISINQLKQQWVDSGKIKQEVFDRIVTACKQQSNWVTWMVKRVAEKSISLEDIEIWKELIPVFERYKTRFRQKDINQIKTSEDIANFRYKITQIKNDTQEKVNTQNQHVEQRVQSRKDNDGYIGECSAAEENFKVYKIRKEDGHHLAMKLGANTSWCTASQNPNYFNRYVEDGPLYVFISEKNPKVKYQIHIQTRQCRDARDQSAFSSPRVISFYDYLVKHGECEEKNLPVGLILSKLTRSITKQDRNKFSLESFLVGKGKYFKVYCVPPSTDLKLQTIFLQKYSIPLYLYSNLERMTEGTFYSILIQGGDSYTNMLQAVRKYPLPIRDNEIVRTLQDSNGTAYAHELIFLLKKCSKLYSLRLEISKSYVNLITDKQTRKWESYLRGREGVLEFYELPTADEIIKFYFNLSSHEELGDSKIIYTAYDTQLQSFILRIRDWPSPFCEFICDYDKYVWEYSRQELSALGKWLSKNTNKDFFGGKSYLAAIGNSVESLDKYKLPKQIGIFTKIYKFPSLDYCYTLSPVARNLNLVAALDNSDSYWSFSKSAFAYKNAEINAVKKVSSTLLEHADDIKQLYEYVFGTEPPRFFQEAIDVSHGKKPILNMPKLLTLLKTTISKKTVDISRIRHSTVEGWEGTWEQYGENIRHSSPKIADEIQECLNSHPNFKGRVVIWEGSIIASDWNCLIQVFDDKGNKVWDWQRSGMGQRLTWTSRKYDTTVQENLSLKNILNKLNQTLLENQQIKQYPVLIGLKGKIKPNLKNILGIHTDILQETENFGLYKTKLLTQKTLTEGCKTLKLELEDKLVCQGVEKIVVMPLKN